MTVVIDIEKKQKLSKALSNGFPVRGSQSGIALIYVMIIFLLITTITSQIVTNLWLHTEKNAKYLERTQAKHYALGAEQYIRRLLEEDFQKDKRDSRMVDHGKELWNVETVDYEVEQGAIQLKVQDEQGRFNLNWIAYNDSESNSEKYGRRNEMTSPDSSRVQMLENLLSTQFIDPQLAYKVERWMKQDKKGLLRETEDQIYLSLETPRRTGQTEMVSVSELLLVDGFNHDIVEKLIPYVTVIPKSSKININTALPEVIRSIDRDISEGDALTIENARGEDGILNVEDLSQAVALSGKAGLFNNELVVFDSQYFSAEIKATYRDTTFYLKTLFYRSSEGRVQVVEREIGPSRYWLPTDEEDSTESSEV